MVELHVCWTLMAKWWENKEQKKCKNIEATPKPLAKNTRRQIYFLFAS